MEIRIRVEVRIRYVMPEPMNRAIAAIVLSSLASTFQRFPSKYSVMSRACLAAVRYAESRVFGLHLPSRAEMGHVVCQHDAASKPPRPIIQPCTPVRIEAHNAFSSRLDLLSRHMKLSLASLSYLQTTLAFGGLA